MSFATRSSVPTDGSATPPAPVAITGVSKIFGTLAHAVWLEQPNSVHLGAELFTREVNMLPSNGRGPSFSRPVRAPGL